MFGNVLPKMLRLPVLVRRQSQCVPRAPSVLLLFWQHVKMLDDQSMQIFFSGIESFRKNNVWKSEACAEEVFERIYTANDKVSSTLPLLSQCRSVRREYVGAVPDAWGPIYEVHLRMKAAEKDLPADIRGPSIFRQPSPPHSPHGAASRVVGQGQPLQPALQAARDVQRVFYQANRTSGSCGRRVPFDPGDKGRWRGRADASVCLAGRSARLATMTP